MNIRKHGRSDELRHITFKCSCWCEFEADITEYKEYTKECKGPNSPCRLFKSEHIWECECPECHRPVMIKDSSTYTVDEVNEKIKKDGKYWMLPTEED